MIFPGKPRYPYSKPVSVNYTTVNDSAVAPGDFTATSGTLTFNPGKTTKSVAVVVISDLILEPTEKSNSYYRIPPMQPLSMVLVFVPSPIMILCPMSKSVT